MANHKSAIKELRQSVARRDRNRGHRSKLRTQIKKLRAAVTDGNTDEAQSLLVPTLSMVDRTAKHGAVNGNAASRTKSRLTKAVNKMAASA
jgi:small subunit ribosomal protein S20